jgi:acetoacetyl-CoA synthetase
LPKAIVHSHGGILLEHLKWLGLQTDLGTRDRVLWLTTTGWVMWNFLVGTLLVGAVPVLYDGSAGHPTISSPWDIAAENGVTCFGAGASYHTACMKAEARLPVAELGSLRMIGSTGSPLPLEAYDYLYEQFGSKIWLFSTSGGTDVATAFVGGSPLVPARRGELQGPALGVDVQAWDEQGNRLVRGVGELVVTKPMPSMPVRLWNDPGDHRLRETYFSTYPGAWRHGDWIEFLENGGALVHGRSDSTINRGGVRIGTAEVYRAVARVPEVVDATIVDVPRKGQENWMVLFVSLPEGVTLGSHLRARIVREIRAACSPRHVPDDVLGVPGVPRTLSGKVLEVPIKRLLMGEAPDRVVSRDSLANPESLDWFVAFAGSLSNTRENTSTEGSNAHVSR